MQDFNLGRLVRPADYQSENSHVFPTGPSLDWFIRKYRERLIDGNALVVVNRRRLIDILHFDRVVVDIGRQLAERE
jgi:hypothetical protein